MGEEEERWTFFLGLEIWRKRENSMQDSVVIAFWMKSWVLIIQREEEFLFSAGSFFATK